MRITVSVELEVNGMPDTVARDHARWILESKGYTVSRVTVAPRPKGEGKTFVPKQYAPGFVMRREGRSYVVWSDAHYAHHVWATPAEPRPSDAPIYLADTRGSYAPRPYHANGSPLNRDEIAELARAGTGEVVAA